MPTRKTKTTKMQKIQVIIMNHNIWDICTASQFKHSEICDVKIFCKKHGKTFTIEMTNSYANITCPYCGDKLKITVILKPQIEEINNQEGNR